MSNTDGRSNQSDASRARPADPSSDEPRYSRRLARKIRELMDGDVARFRVGDSCFMILRIGNDLFVRPFGSGSVVMVNDMPVVEMTPLTLNDCLSVGVGHRRLILRRPKSTETNAMRSVEQLLSGFDSETLGKPASSPKKSGTSFKLPNPNIDR